jgi:hypothetical protein
MDTLNLLNKFSEEHKKPLTKNYNLYDAINEMLYIQDVLKMKNLFLVPPNLINNIKDDIKYDIKYDIKLNIKWLYICNYKHLTTDKEILKNIKELADKLISRYNKYFYNKLNYINFGHIVEPIQIIN